MKGHVRVHRPMVAKSLLGTAVLLSLLAPIGASALENFEMYAPLSNTTKNQADGSTITPPTNNTAAPTSGTTGTQSALFELRPHCDSIDYRAAFNVTNSTTTAIADSACPTFGVKDPQTRQTSVLKEGDPLDMDLIINNPSAQSIQRFRAWIAYDPTAIEGELIEIAKTFPTPTPGANDFSVSDGMIKVSGTADKGQNGTRIIVAHIRLHALATAQSGIPVTFYDATGTPTSHTAIFTKNGTTDTNIASAAPGSLFVQMVPSAVTTGASSAASQTTSNAGTSSAGSEASAVSAAASATSAASSVATPAPTPAVFGILQVQHLKLTTEGSSVFLAWDVLPSADLIGYNLYYGTVSGRYLQKRSVDKNSTTMTIRALPEGITYYFAVRGVNAQNQETDFSQEAGISVGNPKTSTAPLSASTISKAPKTPQTGGTVSGETGLSSTLLLFLLLSAITGTALAFRRQLSAKATV